MVIDYSPFYDLPNYLDRFFDDLWRASSGMQRRMSYPPINVSEDDSHVYVRAEVPGMAMGDLELTLAERSLVIRGERKAQEGKYYRQERPAGAFQRVVNLNFAVDRDKVVATMRDGVLEVVLPKSVPSGPKSIEIKAG